MPAEKIYENNVGRIYKFFYSRVLDRHIAEDLTSDVFAAFLEKINDDIAEPTNYLYGIAKNVWLKHLRDKYSSKIDFYENIEDFKEYIDLEVEKVESQSYLDKASLFIEKLPKKQQEIARLRFLDGLKIKEIAEKLGKEKSYVKTTQNRALKSLKKLFNESQGADI